MELYCDIKGVGPEQARVTKHRYGDYKRLINEMGFSSGQLLLTLGNYNLPSNIEKQDSKRSFA